MKKCKDCKRFELISYSSTYPLDKWFEFEHLSDDFNECRIIIEDYYTE